MEISLHRQLKTLYAGSDAQFEVSNDDYRIDALSDGRLVEIQHGSLAAIRDKVKTLLRRASHGDRGQADRRRKSAGEAGEPGGAGRTGCKKPQAGHAPRPLQQLVHFTRVFPHQRLTLEVPLIDVEEWRYPGQRPSPPLETRRLPNRRPKNWLPFIQHLSLADG